MAVIQLPFGKEKMSITIPDERFNGTLVSKAHQYNADRDCQRGAGASDQFAEIKRACAGQKKYRAYRQRSYAAGTE